VLTPDFEGRMDPWPQVLMDAAPPFSNHKMEQGFAADLRRVRTAADYRQELDLYCASRNIKGTGVLKNSGAMVGLGEKTSRRSRAPLVDLRAADVDCRDAGQYLQPALG